MDIVLCSDCGKLMKRYSTQCVRCTRTNLEYYRDMDSPQLKMRVKELSGSPEYAHPLLSTLLVLALAVAITYAGYSLNNNKQAAETTSRGHIASSPVITR